METRSLFLPVNEGLMHRPRIDALLSKGASSSLIALVAGPGYGKTYAVAKYAEDLPGRLVWLHLQKLDNLPHYFWQDFVQAGLFETPLYSELFEAMAFPATPGAQDTFLRLFSRGIYEGEPLTLVVDDFHFITADEVLAFFERLAAARIPGLTIILCGAASGQLNHLAGRTGITPHVLTLKQLRFTPSEVSALLGMYGMEASKEQVKALWEKTEGWPLAVNLLATQLRFDPSALDGSRWVDLSLTEAIFEREFYSGYAPEVRSLLSKLALLPGFRSGMVEAIGGSGLSHVEKLLAEHPFVTHDAGGSYHYQHMYREFLVSRAIGIKEEEQRRVYRVAAQEYLGRGEKLEAVELLAKGGQYEEMLSIVAAFTNSGMPKQLAAYLLDILSTLPSGMEEVWALAEYLRATILLNNMEVYPAERILLDLAAKYEDNAALRQNESLLGEIYLTLAAICIIQNRDCFLSYYRKAAKILDSGSKLKEKFQCFAGNNNLLFLEHEEPGEVERLEGIYRAAEPYIVQVLNGGGRGAAGLFSAEAAYNKGQFERAGHLAADAISGAAQNKQYDIIFNARAIQARASLAQGNFSGLLASIAAIHEDTEIHRLSDLHDLRDTVEGWFYVKVGDLDRVAPWLVAGADYWEERPPIDIGRERLIYANYLIRKMDFHTAIEFLSGMEHMYRVRGHWLDRLIVYNMRAVAFLNAGEESAALQSLWQGYEMAHANGIIAPFAEGAGYMRILIDIARQRAQFPFDAAWLEEVHAAATTYMKNLSAIMERYKQARRVLDEGGPLTAEATLLLSLSPSATRHTFRAESLSGNVSMADYVAAHP